MKRTLVALALAVVFVLSLAAPALALGYIDHQASYKFYDAVIDLEKQAGHLCNTGAELKQTVKGSAEMFEKDMSVRQITNRITVSQDDASWVAGAAALTVTSVIELCAPAKTEFDVSRFVYVTDIGWRSLSLDDGVAGVADGYWLDWEDGYFFDAPPVGGYDVDTFFTGSLGELGLAAWLAAANTLDDWVAMSAAEKTSWIENNLTEYTKIGLEALTDQIWAVQVVSNPGFSGALEQKWEAAYGPWDGFVDGFGEDPQGEPDEWGFVTDDDYGLVPGFNDDYVGNYFNISQFARTSMGTLRRYIDISSPWSHAYLSEDMTVTGKAEVREAFVMANLPAGDSMQKLWYDLF